MSEFGGLEKLMPYLEHPLVLVGFVLLLFFTVARTVIRSRVLTPITGAKSYRVLQSILLYGFVLSVAVVLLGFGLKYRELSKAEQQNAIDLIRREFDGNLASVEALRKNTLSLLTLVRSTATSLRTPEIVVFKTLFPRANIGSAAPVPPKEMALDALTELLGKKLDKNKSEMSRADAAGKAISGTLDRTRPTIVSLSDANHERYVIRDDAWKANLPIMRKVNIAGVAQLQDSYIAARKLRADYGVVCAAALGYLDALHALLNKKVGVNLDTLTALLTQERQSFALLTAYGQTLAENMASLKTLKETLDRSARPE